MKKEQRIMMGSSKPDGDDRETAHVDLDDLGPEQVMEMLLVFLAQNLTKAGMDEDFILIVRDPVRKRWGSMTTIRDVEELGRILRLLGNNVPDEVEEKILKPEDLIKRSN